MALRMTTMLLLLFLIAAVGSANGQQIVGVGKHTVNPDRTVKLAEGWNIATEKGSQPKGYQEYQCPIEIKENGDITVMYTKSGGGKTGCGLDLVAKKPVDDTIRFTIAITTSDPNTCVTEESIIELRLSLSPAYNMLPFIHSVDNQEFQRMSKGGGWFGPDKDNCLDAEQCKNTEGKYQCRKFTTYEFGWNYDMVRMFSKAFVKPVGENALKLKGNYFTFFAPIQPHTLIVTSEKFEVEGSNKNDEGIKPNFQCTPQPAKLYPVISWTIDNREGTTLNGRHLLFFGLLAQDWQRDYFENFEEGLPRCDFSVTFKGGDYELLHQEFVPTPTILTSGSNLTTFNAPEDDQTLMWILIGCGSGAVVLLVVVGVLIYCMCFRNGEEDEEEGEEEEGDAEKGTTLTSYTTTKTGGATAFGRSGITAVPPTKGDGTTMVDKKTKATTNVTKATKATKATKVTKADQKTKATTKVTKADKTRIDQKTKATKATKTTAATTNVTKGTKAPTKKTKADKTYQEVK